MPLSEHINKSTNMPLSEIGINDECIETLSSEELLRVSQAALRHGFAATLLVQAVNEESRFRRAFLGGCILKASRSEPGISASRHAQCTESAPNGIRLWVFKRFCKHLDK